MIEGPVVQVAPVHAKIRRDGYRGQKPAGDGTGSGGVPSSSPQVGSGQCGGVGLGGVEGGER
ncbi:hypothetical protein E1287_09835 [Actinomadura sp. KC06]|nr:hypothetical protein E1287_09835 [Actinomadura sp. KC06]